MTEEVKPKNKGGRPKGSKNKDKNLSLSDLWDSLSVKEKKKTFASATPNQKLSLVSALEKRSRISETNRVSVNFNLTGICTTCPECGYKPPPEEPSPSPPPALPPKEDPRMPHARSEVCPEIEERRQRTPEEERELALVNERLKRRDQELREANIMRQQMGLPPVGDGSLPGRGGVEDC